MFSPLCDEMGTWLILIHSTLEGTLLTLHLFRVLQGIVALAEMLLLFRAQYENSKAHIKTQPRSPILLSHKP